MGKSLRKFLFSLVTLCSLTSLTTFAVEPISLTHVVMTQYADEGDAGGQFIMVLATGATTVDEDWGVYRTEDDGELMTITLYADGSTEAYPKLPVGEYTMGAGSSKGTWSNVEGFNAFVSYTKAGGCQPSVPTAGSLTVTEEGGNTILNGTVTVNGTDYTFNFSGRIPFQGPNADGKIYENINTTFTGGAAVYRELIGFNSALELQLWDGEPDDNGQILDGNIVKVRFVTPLVDYVDGRFGSVPVGTYQVTGTQEVGSILPGEDDGINLPTGSYAASTSGGISLLGMVAEGEMTVTGGENGVYQVSVDLVTEEGASIIGTYNGTFEYYDQVGSGKEFNSTLTEDKVIEYPNIKEIQFMDHGDFYVQNLRVIEMKWMDLEEMKGTMVELLLPMAPKGTEIPEGVYPVSPIGFWSANTFTVGQVLNLYLIGTWGHFKLGDNGGGMVGILQNDMGPAYDGTITLTKVGDEYRVELDLVDDTKPTPYTMKMDWTGKISYDTTQSINDALLSRPSSPEAPFYDLKGLVRGYDSKKLNQGVYIKNGRKIFVGK